VRLVAALVVSTITIGGPAEAQTVSGYASVMFDTFPQIDVTELRSRVFAEYRRDLNDRVRLVASGFAEALIAERGEPGLIRTGILRPQEVSLETAWERADLRVGLSRVTWGRLDELLPTDVVNPLDLTKFFFEGRAEGRMPVALVRARWLPSESFTLESIYVPFFRRGRFDELDEETAPFAIRLPLPVERREPPRTVRNGQGGVRATATSGRVDWSVSAYRGFEPLPVYEGSSARFPRFTMIGGDFETVRGQWGLRGELAAFVDRTLQLQNAPTAVKGKALEGGLGVDRRAGSYRVSGTVMLTSRIANVAELDRRDLTLVGAIDRSFARETRSLRVFAAYNPGERAGFARAIGAFSLRDNLSLEVSGGVFAGIGLDVFARFSDREFLYIRLKAFY
jgi:hypothetical protein